MSELRDLMDRILADGVLTADEHDEFLELIHADGDVDEKESAEISRIFKLLQEGKLKVVDEARDSIDREVADELKQDVLSATQEREEERNLQARVVCEKRVEARKAEVEGVLSAVAEEEEAELRLAEEAQKAEQESAQENSPKTRKASIASDFLQKAKELVE